MKRMFMHGSNAHRVTEPIEWAKRHADVLGDIELDILQVQG